MRLKFYVFNLLELLATIFIYMMLSGFRFQARSVKLLMKYAFSFEFVSRQKHLHLQLKFTLLTYIYSWWSVVACGRKLHILSDRSKTYKQLAGLRDGLLFLGFCSSSKLINNNCFGDIVVNNLNLYSAKLEKSDLLTYTL